MRMRALWKVGGPGLLFALIVGCGSGSPPVSTSVDAASATAGAAGEAVQGPNLLLKIDPSPPRVGDNEVEVVLSDADGTPIRDATVAITFYMPAMPSMSMPEMRSSAVLTGAEAGQYRGKGKLVMAGTWNVTIDVSRGGEKLATRKMSIIAK